MRGRVLCLGDFVIVAAPTVVFAALALISFMKAMIASNFCLKTWPPFCTYQTEAQHENLRGTVARWVRHRSSVLVAYEESASTDNCNSDVVFGLCKIAT